MSSRRGSPGYSARALNEHIANVKRSGTWSRLTVKYFGEMALEVLQKARAE